MTQLKTSFPALILIQQKKKTHLKIDMDLYQRMGKIIKTLCKIDMKLS